MTASSRIPSEEIDDRYLHWAAGILFLSSFSWWHARISTYVAGGVGGTQLMFRVLPVMAVWLILLHRDARSGFRAMVALFSWPILALIWYAILGAMAGLSSPLPKLALWKGIEVSAIAYFAAHAALLPRARLDRLLERVLKFAILLVLWVVVAAILNPRAASESGPRFLLSGYFPIINSNGVGTWAAVSVVALAGGLQVLRGPWVRFLIVATVSCALLLAWSRTGFLAAALGLGVLGVNVVRTDRERGLVLVGGAAAAVGLAILDIQQLLDAVARGQSLESIRNLSGRMEYWSVGAQVIFQRPWMGGGLATGSRFLTETFAEVFSRGAVNLHSAPIEILVGAGIIGGVPLLVWVVVTVLRGGWGAMAISCARRPCAHVLAAAIALMLAPRFFLSIAMASFSAELLLFMLVGLVLRQAHGTQVVSVGTSSIRSVASGVAFAAFEPKPLK